MTHYEILPAEQRALLPHLAALRPLGYVLYGGTAVALQLGHRASVDFDFSTDRPYDEAAIRAASPVLADAVETQRAERTLTLEVGGAGSEVGVKVSFFAGFRFGRVGIPTMTTHGELRLASLDDLLGHKLRVLIRRVQAKDYQDVAAMLRNGQRLERGLGAAQALGTTFPIAETARTLGYFEGGDLARLSAGDRAVLTRASRHIGEVEPLPILSQSLS